MNVFYEEEGELRSGSVLADNTTSLQVEAPHGKRSKVKAGSVLFRFDAPGARALIDDARSLAETLDTDFLWEAITAEEFGFDTAASEYFGAAPGKTASAIERAAMLMKLHASPMYFYKRGKGQYRRAPAESLKAALAGIERKRREAEQQHEWSDALARFELPEPMRALVPVLLYAPDKQSIAFKALDAASTATGTSVPRLLERCGALASAHDYHYGKFLFEHFRNGTGFAPVDVDVDAQAAALPPLEIAPVQAFSIDDSATTEIDDAFSVQARPDGWRIGIHIAAPALGIAAGSALDEAALARQSTAYFPGRKITMLPDPIVERFTLAAGRTVPALSLYADVDAGFAVQSTCTVLEAVPIGENLRLDRLEPCFSDDALAQARDLPEPRLDHPCGSDLWTLWRFALARQAVRGKQPESALGGGRVEYTFIVDGEHVELKPRARGAPLDTLVAELMIFANSQWGGELARAQVPAIYRAQGGGKVHLTTVPSPHQGLGVAHYTWASSPLRRMVDLVNQRQLVSWVRGEPPPYPPGSESMLSAMRAFELTYDAYAEAQRTMERYWSLVYVRQ
ncbi:MAG: RNB domain-containing ribonuclease, partial [Proteobacteria bacterium]|nr:RNB domain-containing ribonuclease [Burkholderiales bacterium]